MPLCSVRLFLLQWVFYFWPEVILLAVRFFLFAVGLFSFAVSFFFYFAVSFFLFCRKFFFYFAVRSPFKIPLSSYSILHYLSTVPRSLSPVPCSLLHVFCSTSSVLRSLFPIPRSLFPVHCSLFSFTLFSVHHSLFLSSPFPVPSSLFTVLYFLLPVPCCLFSISRLLFSVPRFLFPVLYFPFSIFSSRFSVHRTQSTDPYSLISLFPKVKGNIAWQTDTQTSPSSVGVGLHCWTFAVLSHHARHSHPFVRDNEAGFLLILRLLLMSVYS